jgi:hypothetical protein
MGKALPYRIKRARKRVGKWGSLFYCSNVLERIPQSLPIPLRSGFAMVASDDIHPVIAAILAFVSAVRRNVDALYHAIGVSGFTGSACFQLHVFECSASEIFVSRLW